MIAPSVYSYKQMTTEMSIVRWSRAQITVTFGWFCYATRQRSLFNPPCNLLLLSTTTFVRMASRRMATHIQSKGYFKPTVVTSMVEASPSYGRSCTVALCARARNISAATDCATTHSICSWPRPAIKDTIFTSTMVERGTTTRLCLTKNKWR